MGWNICFVIHRRIDTWGYFHFSFPYGIVSVLYISSKNVNIVKLLMKWEYLVFLNMVYSEIFYI